MEENVQPGVDRGGQKTGESRGSNVGEEAAENGETTDLPTLERESNRPCSSQETPIPHNQGETDVMLQRQPI